MESKELNNEIQELLHKMRLTELTDSEWDRLGVLGSEDPFLMDAIEGLRLLPTKERADRIKSIETSLDELLGERRKKKTLMLPLRRVAAALILILGFWVVWQAFPDGESKLAQNEHIVSQEQQDEQESQKQQGQQELLESPAPQGQHESLGSLNQVDPIEEASGVQRNLSIDADVKKGNEAAPPAESRSGNEINNDVIATEIVASDYQESATETAIIETPTKEIDPDISSVHYQAETRSATRAAPLKAEQDPVGLATPSAQRSADSGSAKTQDADLRSIVYNNTEIDTSPTTVDKSKMKQPKKNQAPDHISYALAIPQMGWNSYYKYIRKNIVTPKAAKEASVSGTVMLEFDLKPDGSPHNFRIVQSLGYGCDEEAIRLVREGPKWDVKNSQVEIGGLSVEF